MKRASPPAPPQAPMDSQTPALCQGWHCLLSTCVPAPSTGQGLRRQQIQGLAQGSSGEEPRLIPDPQAGEPFVFCLSVQTLLKSTGVARGPGWQGSL